MKKYNEDYEWLPEEFEKDFPGEIEKNLDVIRKYMGTETILDENSMFYGSLYIRLLIPKKVCKSFLNPHKDLIESAKMNPFILKKYIEKKYGDI